jgi:hypothetical protein
MSQDELNKANTPNPEVVPPRQAQALQHGVQAAHPDRGRRLQ